MTHEETWIRVALEQFEAPLLRYATHLSGNLDRARDVVQDTFLRLCKQNRAEVEGHLAEWLFTVCRNRVIDLQRKEMPMSSIEGLEKEPVEGSAPSPEAHALDLDTQNHVARLMRDLPPNQQEVLRLKFQHDLSYAEISRVTNLSVSHVGFLLHTAIKALRGRMSAEAPMAQAMAEKGW